MIAYIPVVTSSHLKREAGEILAHSPSIRDIINISYTNLFWSPILKQLHYNFSANSIEILMGIPICVLALFLASYITQIFKVVRKSLTEAELPVLFLATVIIFVSIAILKQGDFSIWARIYTVIPGASALRAMGRYFILLNMIAVILSISTLNQLSQNKTSSLIRFVTLALIPSLLIVEQINISNYRLNKNEQLQFINVYQKPAIPCNAFYLYNAPSGKPVYQNWAYQVDAMMISMKIGIPTVNGYSGYIPNEVFAMLPNGNEYKYKMLKWLYTHKSLSGICELDYVSGVFSPINVSEEYKQAKREEFLLIYTALLSATTKYLQDNNELYKLSPKRLIYRGYLDSSFGFAIGPSRNWTQNGEWIGPWNCKPDKCFAIGIEGNADEVREIIEQFKPIALQIYYPYPKQYNDNIQVDGFLLLVFKVE
jgi:hypothetical protein